MLGQTISDLGKKTATILALSTLIKFFSVDELLSSCSPGVTI